MVSTDSAAALARELREEIHAEIGKPTLLGVLENIYTYRGQRGHDIDIIYRATLLDENFYRSESVEKFDGESTVAKWVDLKDFRAGEKVLYPEGLLNLISSAD